MHYFTFSVFLLEMLPLYFVHLYSVRGAGLGLKLPFEAELMIMREVIMDLYSFTTTLLLSVGDQIEDFYCLQIMIDYYFCTKDFKS